MREEREDRSGTDDAGPVGPADGDASVRDDPDASTDAVVAVDRQGRVRGWNRRARVLYGLDAEQSLGRELLDLPPFRDDEDLARALREGWRISTAASRAQGDEASAGGPGATLPSPSDPWAWDGATIVVRTSFSDGERRAVAELERRLEKEQALLETVLEQMPSGLRIAAPSGNLILHNRMATELMGAPLVSDLAAKGEAPAVARLDGTPYRIEDLPLARALRGETVRQEEMVAVDPQGERRYRTVNAAPVRDEDGEIVAAVVTFDDVTERKRVEEELREARARVERTVERLRRTEEELREANERLRHDAVHDALTGLPNRTLLIDRAERAMRRLAEDPGRDAALLYLDFDHFKLVNDSLGHAVGDAMLVSVGRGLAGAIRPEDTVARMGGDEFVILAERVESDGHAVALAERIRAAFERPVDAAGHAIYTSVSIGIVPSLATYEDAEAAMRDADTAMYAAKNAGRGRYRVFDRGMRAEAVAAMELENDLRRALREDEFRVRYAPVHRVADGALAGFEARLRWEHPQRGTLVPRDFLEVATEMGIARSIDERVWREASRTVNAWRARFGWPLTLSLNFSRRHFLSPKPERALLEVLRETDAAPERTIVELEPSALHDPSEEVGAALRSIAGRGIGVHLGGFGTDLAPLFTLRRFGVGGLKIDASLVAGLANDAEEPEPVVVSLQVARTLGLESIAEGVEHPGQLERLAELGCTFAQGRLFADALAPDEAVAYVAATGGGGRSGP